VPTFSDLSRAAFCPRQLYYARREADRKPPPEARERIALAFEYDRLVDAPDGELLERPVRREPAAYRRALRRVRDRHPERWRGLVAPDDTRVLLEGKDCRGVAHKVIEGRSPEADGTDAGTDGDAGGRSGDGNDEPPPIPTVVSPGEPPERGVWETHTVRAVAAAKALAWERERPIPRALVEYPAHGVVREVRLTTRRKAAYRRALRAVRSLDGPPPRRNDGRCESCAYRAECGVKTRSLRSLLGL